MEELTTLLSLVPLNPRILRVVETSQSSLDYFERLSLLANGNNHTRLYLERRNVDNLTINSDVLVTNELTSSSAGRSNTQTVYYVVKATLKQLEQHLTGDTLSLSGLLKQVTELALKNTIGILGFLLLCQHDSVLRHLTTTVVAMLSRGEVPTGQNFVCAEDGLTKTTRNF